MRQLSLAVIVSTLAVVGAACGSEEDAAGNGDTGGSTGTGERDLPLDCSTGNDCVIAHDSCCGYDCGQPDLDDFVVMRADALSDYRAEMCTDHDPENCPNCPGYAQANFVSVCRSGTCQGVDVRVDELSACETEADCSLRWGGDCCEDCEGETTGGFGEYLIAISDPSTFRAHVCQDVPGCPPCLDVTYPAGARADCVGGHCAVIQD
jgi:hypothetical protein